MRRPSGNINRNSIITNLDERKRLTATAFLERRGNCGALSLINDLPFGYTLSEYFSLRTSVLFNRWMLNEWLWIHLTRLVLTWPPSFGRTWSDLHKFKIWGYNNQISEHFDSLLIKAFLLLACYQETIPSRPKSYWNLNTDSRWTAIGCLSPKKPIFS